MRAARGARVRVAPVRRASRSRRSSAPTLLRRATHRPRNRRAHSPTRPGRRTEAGLLFPRHACAIDAGETGRAARRLRRTRRATPSPRRHESSLPRIPEGFAEISLRCRSGRQDPSRHLRPGWRRSERGHDGHAARRDCSVRDGGPMRAQGAWATRTAGESGSDRGPDFSVFSRGTQQAAAEERGGGFGTGLARMGAMTSCSVRRHTGMRCCLMANQTCRTMKEL